MPSASFNDSMALFRLCSMLSYCYTILTTIALQGPGKKWEHYDLNKNGKPIRLPMHVQRGDMVQIISGAEKGKTGKITNVSFSWLLLHLVLLVSMPQAAVLNTCRS